MIKLRSSVRQKFFRSQFKSSFGVAYICVCDRESWNSTFSILAQFILRLSFFSILFHLHSLQNSIEFMGVKIYGAVHGLIICKLKTKHLKWVHTRCCCCCFCSHTTIANTATTTRDGDSLHRQCRLYCFGAAVFSQFDSTTILAIFHTNFPSYRIMYCIS